MHDNSDSFELAPGGCTVHVVDDDYRVREGLQALLEANGYGVQTYVNLQQFKEGFNGAKQSGVTCVLLDVQLPDGNGLELHAALPACITGAVIFITGHADVQASLKAWKQGAADFLLKPFSEAELLDAVKRALVRGAASNGMERRLHALKSKFATLSERERDVLPLVVGGLMNKQAAAVLGISEVTLQIHRRSIMRKMEAESLPDLVRMADTLRIPISLTRRSKEC